MIASFFAQLPREEIWHGGQERDFPWGAIRTVEEIVDDPHLEDWGFYVEVEHPELGRSFIYPGPAAIYNDSLGESPGVRRSSASTTRKSTVTSWA